MRGRLRRIAAEDVFDALKGRGETISLEVYHGMTCGAVTGQPAKGLTLNWRLNPVSILFWVLRRRPSIGTVCFAGESIVAYHGEDDQGRPCSRALRFREGRHRLAYPRHLLRPVDDALEFYNGNASLIINGYSDAIAHWIKDVARQKKEGE